MSGKPLSCSTNLYGRPAYFDGTEVPPPAAQRYQAAFRTLPTARSLQPYRISTAALLVRTTKAEQDKISWADTRTNISNRG